MLLQAVTADNLLLSNCFFPMLLSVFGIQCARLRQGKAEAEVDRLEKEKTEITTELATPNEKINFASLSRRLQQLQYEIDIATSKWEEATAALEKVVGESGGEREG
jgi:hypothetical protein